MAQFFGCCVPSHYVASWGGIASKYMVGARSGRRILFAPRRWIDSIVSASGRSRCAQRNSRYISSAMDSSVESSFWSSNICRFFSCADAICFGPARGFQCYPSG